MSDKPLVLVAVAPMSGHLMPIIPVIKNLVNRGYDVTVITGTGFKDKIDATGAEFLALEGRANYRDETFAEVAPLRDQLPPSLERTAYDVEELLVAPMHEQFAALQKGLKKLSGKGKPVVILSEALFMGTHPLTLGAPGLKPAGLINLGIGPITLPSATEDSDPVIRERERIVSLALEELFSKANARQKRLCNELGAVKEPMFLWEHGYHGCDRFLQLCPPSLEFPRGDTLPTLRFAGSVPRSSMSEFVPPVWWSDVLSAKNVIAVTQGTFAVEYSHLIIPTLEGLKDSPDTLIFVILGRRGAKLPESYEIPKNAKVVDYFPYDAILEHAKVFVTNAGYGGVQQSLSHGVPLVMAGDTEDKPEVAERSAIAGVGINLGTGQPTPEQVNKGVMEVLSNDKYRTRSKEVQEEMKHYNAMDIIEQNISEVARGL